MHNNCSYLKVKVDVLKFDGKCVIFFMIIYINMILSLMSNFL